MKAICLIIAAMTIAVPPAGAEARTRVSSVVRADARSGRLVRTLVVSPRVLSPGVIAPRVIAPVAHSPSRASQDVGSIVQTVARELGVEAELVHSVIQVESAYNPYAVSPKGAQGLMQLIPATARRFGAANSFDVRQNIEAGVKYLRYLQDMFQDDRLALAAYNAGEGAVLKHGGIPPYRETVDYVQRVGQKLGQARRTNRSATPPPAAPAPQVPAFASLEAHTDSEGRLHLRTREEPKSP